MNWTKPTTLTHQNLIGIPLEEARREMAEDKEGLAKLFGKCPVGMAYPFGTFNDEMVNLPDELGFKYARTVWPSHNFDVHADLLRFRPICHHDDEKLFEQAGQSARLLLYQHLFLPIQLLWWIQMSWNTIHHNRGNIPLNQRFHIGNKVLRYIGAILVNPLARDALFVVGDFVDVFDGSVTLVWVVGDTLQHNHLAGVAFVGGLDGGTAYLVGL